MLLDSAACDRALAEVRSTPLCHIHYRTAYTWAWRAWAANVLSTGYGDAASHRHFEKDLVEYGHEAIEHAALTGSLEVLDNVRKIIANTVPNDTLDGIDVGEAETAALQELQTKTLVQIQTETAYVWAYRAWAAYVLDYVVDAVDYEQEALEHAALSGLDSVLETVKKIVSTKGY